MTRPRAAGRAMRAPNLWQLARIQADAFAGGAQAKEQWPLFPRACVLITSLMALAVSERRVGERGQAVCLLWRRTNMAALRGACVLLCLLVPLALAVLATAVLWGPLPWALGFVLLTVLAPCAWSGWSNRRQKRRLANSTTGRDSAVFLHSLARVPGESARGAGATVVRQVVAEADREGWTLVLDAGVPGLADYYSRFGFEPVCGPVTMSWGQVVRMVREPVGAGA